MLGRSLRVLVVTHETFELELLGVSGLAVDSVRYDCMAVGSRALFVLLRRGRGLDVGGIEVGEHEDDYDVLVMNRLLAGGYCNLQRKSKKLILYKIRM
jgi:hypothetical protein